jgi:hypothetical protein
MFSLLQKRAFTFRFSASKLLVPYDFFLLYKKAMMFTLVMVLIYFSLSNPLLTYGRPILDSSEKCVTFLHCIRCPRGPFQNIYTKMIDMYVHYITHCLKVKSCFNLH